MDGAQDGARAGAGGGAGKPPGGVAKSGERAIRLPSEGGKDGAYALRGFRERYVVTRWVLLRLLGLISLVTLISSGLEMLPLVGDGGLTPARVLLERAQELASRKGLLEGIRVFPSLYWLLPSDIGLQILVVGGVVASVMLVVGAYPGPALLALWATWLSICTAGGVFFATEWDSLLLEVLLVSLFWAPWQKRPGLQSARPPSRNGRLLLKYLVLKIFFLSALSRLLSNEPHWEALTALSLHFTTQHLPASPAWFVQQWSEGVKSGMTAIVYAIGLLFPWLMWLGRPLRMAAFWGFAITMALFAITGNYGFFPLLTVSLCVVLLDDEALLSLCPQGLRQRILDQIQRELAPGAPVPKIPRMVAVLGHWMGTLLLAVVVVAGAADAWTRATAHPAPGPLRMVVRWIEASRSVNAYHFLHDIREHQRVVAIEVSVDGKSFQHWPFPAVPGTLEQAPPFIPLIVPRMGLAAALASDQQGCGNVRWFQPLLRGLAAGDANAIRVMGPNPLPDVTPRHIRSVVYDYTFTTSREAGAWWERRRVGSFCGVMRVGAEEPFRDDERPVGETTQTPQPPKKSQPAGKKQRASAPERAGTREGSTGFER